MAIGQLTPQVLQSFVCETLHDWRRHVLVVKVKMNVKNYGTDVTNADRVWHWVTNMLLATCHA